MRRHALGSLHYDITVQSPRQPVTGETLAATSWAPKCGGKGGNQAVASAKTGLKTYMVAALGQDDFGKALRTNLQTHHVDCRYLRDNSAHSTGMSVALFDAQGDYSAVIVSGANLSLGAQDVQKAQSLLNKASITLLQNEIPEQVNILAAMATKKGGGKVILNAAPARFLPQKLIELCDFIIVNKVEAQMLTHTNWEETLNGALDAAGFLYAQFHKNSLPSPAIIVTMGGVGVAYQDKDGHYIKLPAEKVVVQNSHGAGDEFIGVFGAHLAQGKSVEAALMVANKAAAKLISTP